MPSEEDLDLDCKIMEEGIKNVLILIGIVQGNRVLEGNIIG